MISLGIKIGLGVSRGAKSSAPRIRLSSTAPIPEDTAVGTTLATVSVVNGSGVYTLAITVDPDSKFALDGAALKLAASVDYETATSHSVTLSADNDVDDPIIRTFTFVVSNVLEQPSLSALTLDDDSLPEGAAATINILGATTGSTITLASGDLPTGMTLNSGARTISGTPTVLGSTSFTLRETLADSPNSPRDTALGVEVTEVGEGVGATFDNASITWDDTSYTWDIAA